MTLFRTLMSRTDHLAVHCEMASTLEKHAPLRKRTVTLRLSLQWYTTKIKAVKSMRRRLEHKWRSNKSEDNRKRYVDECNMVNNLIYQTKMTLYSTSRCKLFGQ
jgi:hypothetical protein